MGMKYEHPISSNTTRADLHRLADAAGVPMNARLSIHVTRGDRPGESDRTSLVWSWEVEETTAAPEPPSPRVVHTLLLLVQDEFPAPMPWLKDIISWSDETRDQVARWASAVHLAASDNDVPIPDMPAVLKAGSDTEGL